MGITLSTGTIVAIAKTYGASVNMTAIGNAAEAVATLAAGHGCVVGDYLEISSGWGRLDKRVVRVKTVATNDVTLEGIATTNTTLYPAGTGAGTIRRITAWDNLSQLKDLSVSGGDQQFADITAIDDVVERKVPTIRSAVALSMTVMDDPSQAWYATVQAAADAASVAGLRMSFPNGTKLLANAYWSLQKTPNVAKNEALTAKVDASYAADPVRYAT